MGLIALVTVALAGTCTEITAADIVSVPPPAVIVLGERPGVAPDGPRAARVVRQLLAAAPVTVALEALPPATQGVLDRYDAGDIPTERLRDRLEWDRHVGLPWRPYSDLVTSALNGATVVAAAAAPELPPDGADFPVAPGYLEVLLDALGGHEMPLSLESRYLRTASWRDHRIAAAAAAAWDEQGYLVVVTHRARVEGGYGVPWQLEHLVDAPVHGFTLAWGGAPPCYDGDKVWKETLLERIFGG